MLSSVQIQGFRCFPQFEMSNLGRINLLVGTNNSGKTSVLEAIYLLACSGDPDAISQLLMRRGERFVPTVLSSESLGMRRPPDEFDVSHLFSGHEAMPGSCFRVTAQEGHFSRVLDVKFSEQVTEQAEIFSEYKRGLLGPRFSLTLNGNPSPPLRSIPLTQAGGLLADSSGMAVPRGRQNARDVFATQFVSTESLSSDDLIVMWNKIALTPSESLVLSALQFLDPDIERIAAQTVGPSRSRGGFIIKRQGQPEPVPIGSMGDGIWRMLAMAIAITQCKGGILLVDEIDTGLHYTVMSQMWNLIYHVATDLDVQVFATTHSYDCVYSLAQICSNEAMQREVTVQRIEPGKTRSIPYDEVEITAAASRDIEVR